MVECLLAKEDDMGSSPIRRSVFFVAENVRVHLKPPALAGIREEFR